MSIVSTNGTCVTAPPWVVCAIPVETRLELYRGDTFAFDIAVTDSVTGDPWDLTGATARASIKASHRAAAATELFCAVAGSTITVHITAEQASALPERGVWDAQVSYLDGRVFTLAFGPVAVHPEVTT